MLAISKMLLLHMRIAGKLVYKQILPCQRSWEVEHWIRKSVVSSSRTYTMGKVIHKSGQVPVAQQVLAPQYLLAFVCKQHCS